MKRLRKFLVGLGTALAVLIDLKLVHDFRWEGMATRRVIEYGG